MSGQQRTPALHAHSTVTQTGEYLHPGIGRRTPAPLRGAGGSVKPISAPKNCAEPTGLPSSTRSIRPMRSGTARPSSKQARDVGPPQAEHPRGLDPHRNQPVEDPEISAPRGVSIGLCCSRRFRGIATIAKASKRAALYVRVSTDHRSVENQTRELRQGAEHGGWQVAEVYRDAGITGTKGPEPAPRCAAQ